MIIQQNFCNRLGDHAHQTFLGIGDHSLIENCIPVVIFFVVLTIFLHKNKITMSAWSPTRRLLRIIIFECSLAWSHSTYFEFMINWSSLGVIDLVDLCASVYSQMNVKVYQTVTCSLMLLHTDSYFGCRHRTKSCQEETPISDILYEDELFKDLTLESGLMEVISG